MGISGTALAYAKRHTRLLRSPVGTGSANLLATQARTNLGVRPISRSGEP